MFKKSANKIAKLYTSRKTLDSRVFAIVLVVGTIVTGISTLFTFIEGLGRAAAISTFICFLFLLFIGFLAYGLKKEALGQILLCIFLNFVLLPVTFFVCGGVKSGMILYFLTCLYIIVPCIADKRLRIGIFVLSLSMLCLTIYLSTYVLTDLVAPVTNDTWYTDVIASLILNAFCIYYISHLTVVSYAHERRRNEQLLERLQRMAVRDELTGLYNRREMFDRLGRLFSDNEDSQTFIMMLDVDNFKKANDTYGHLFGDEVLRKISAKLSESLDNSKNEFAARYGGEEFVVVMQCRSYEHAKIRAEVLRQAIYDIHYEEHPDKHISISGGLVECKRGSFSTIEQLLLNADKLLYDAKSQGKNRVISE